MGEKMKMIEISPWLKAELSMLTSQMIYYDINLLDISEKPAEEAQRLGYTMDNYLTNFIKMIKKVKPNTRHLLQVLSLRRLKTGVVYILTDGMHTIQAKINEKAKIKELIDSDGTLAMTKATQLSENTIIQVNRYKPLVYVKSNLVKIELGDILIISSEEKVKFRGQPLEENIEIRTNVDDFLHDRICLQCYEIKKNDIYKVANCILEEETYKIERELKRKNDKEYNKKYYENFDDFCDSINSFYGL